MASDSDPNERVGWELGFRSGVFPPRYQTDAAPNDSVVEWADTLLAGCFILDVGCGVGRHLIYLGGRGFRMAGLDASPTGVRISQAACAERGIALDARAADMTALPWAEAVFDAALSTATVCHHLRADILKTMAEVRRVLRPGGLFLVDFLHKETVAYERVRAQAAAGQISEVEPETFVDDGPEPDLNDDAFLPHHYCDEAEVRALLANFEVLRVWADLAQRPPDGGPANRGHWVAWARRPLSG